MAGPTSTALEVLAAGPSNGAGNNQSMPRHEPPYTCARLDGPLCAWDNRGILVSQLGQRAAERVGADGCHRAPDARAAHAPGVGAAVDAHESVHRRRNR